VAAVGFDAWAEASGPDEANAIERAIDFGNSAPEINRSGFQDPAAPGSCCSRPDQGARPHWVRTDPCDGATVLRSAEL
jgi:hypothetical protein